MADKQEDTVIGVVGGFLAAVGGTALYQFARDRAGEFVKNKAEEVFTDRGRGPILRDILSLEPAQAAKLRSWLDQAQAEGTEGGLINLLLKLPDDPKEGRRKEFAKLAELGSYDEFVKTLNILDQDNLFQLAKRVVNNGAPIVDADVKEFLACLGKNIRHAGTGIDNAARKAAPSLHALAGWIRSKG